MADLSTLTADLPPQATSGLPGAAANAADMNDIAKAPPAEDALLAANFGDAGAENYRNLRAAGQAATRPTANPLAVMAGMGPAGMPAAAPQNPANQTSELVAGGLARGLQAIGDPRLAAQQAQAQQKSIAAAASARREAANEFFTQLMPAAFKQFIGRPDLAASFLQNAATSRGIQVDPAVLLKLNQDMQDGQLTPAKLGEILSDPTTNIDTVMRLGTKASFISDVAKGQAEAQKAVAEATAAPTKVSNDATKAALDIASKLRQAQQPPSQSDIATLDAAGMEPYQTDIPGVPGAKRWDARRKTGEGNGDIAAGLRQGKVDAATNTALAKEQVLTTMNTRTMKEKAPKVIQFIDRLRKNLDVIETGPAASRFQDFMSGKVGAPNPDFMRYRINSDLLATMLMQMHVGSRGSEGMLEHFHNMLAANKQSAPNMRAALDEIEAYAKDVAKGKEGVTVGPRGAQTASVGASTAGAAATPEISAQDFLAQ